MADEPRLLADRYLLEEELTQGGMGSVWRARDQVLARTVAVKILHDHLARDSGFLERFRREAISAARLTHPNVVSIYDTGEQETDGGTEHYIVMEYCPGGTLEDVMTGHRSLAPDRIASIGAGIASALEHAHAEGVIHRDVKPANVLVGSDGTLKVADFGIAKAVEADGDVTTTGRVLGTVAYISPEHATSGDLDARSDIYSLGIVLYELAVGRPPFAGEGHLATAMKHVREAPVPVRSLRAGIPRELEAIVMKALAKDPDERFQTASEMRRALERIRGSAAAQTAAFPVPPPSPQQSMTLRSETRWIIPVLAVVIVTILLALGINALLGEQNPLDENREAANGGASELDVVGVVDLDPAGDGEHPEDAPLAADGNPATSWTTQDYFSSTTFTGKGGVGLVFDLRESAAVSRVELRTPEGGFDISIGVADEAGTEIDDFSTVTERDAIALEETIEFDEVVSGRYWLILITRLPGAGVGDASIAEVSFFGN
jgi:serine/threonine protein kinase